MFGLPFPWPLPERFRLQPLLRSLVLRFMIVAVPLLLVFVVFNLFFVAQREQVVLTEALRTRAFSLCRNLALNGAQARESFGDYLLQPISRAASRLPDVAWVVFADERGHVLAEAGPDTVEAHRRGPLADALLHQHEAVEVIDDGAPGFIGVCVPMSSREGGIGTVSLGLNAQRLRVAAAGSRQDALNLTLLLVLGISTVTFPLVYLAVRPLSRIVQAAREISKGRLETRVAVERKDELGRLGLALNRMAERLGGVMARERAKRAVLEARVAELRACGERVASGDLAARAPAGDDELGRLASGFNEMVEHVQRLLHAERSMQKDLEANQAVLQAANTRLLDLDRRKSDFLNTVSHELRTPLTSIKAFTEILLDQEGRYISGDEASGRAEEREFLSIIDQEADRLTRLIDDLLDLTRIEAESTAEAFVTLPLGVVVEGSVRSCRALAEQKDISVSLDISGEVTVRGDRDRLAQVVTNLLSNAIKFTPSGGSVTVTVSRSGTDAVLSVSDTGVGIAHTDLERIFEEFQQVDRSRGDAPSGSGLGLPIVRRIVERHGGRVSVRSAVSQGSTFTVTLPSVG
ncbi:MAG: HAMP domain-containing protein [Proteobacteria bacterium]|nr:HAMP domain-containing protein [Pseudomonadota bacterium]